MNVSLIVRPQTLSEYLTKNCLLGKMYDYRSLVNKKKKNITFFLNHDWCFISKEFHTSPYSNILLDERGCRFQCSFPFCQGDGKDVFLMDMEDLPPIIKSYWDIQLIEPLDEMERLLFFSEKECKSIIKKWYQSNCDIFINIHHTENMFFSEPDIGMFGLCGSCLSPSFVFVIIKTGWYMKCFNCQFSVPKKGVVFPFVHSIRYIQDCFTLFETPNDNQIFTQEIDHLVFPDKIINDKFIRSINLGKSGVAGFFVSIFGHIYHATFSPKKTWYQLIKNEWIGNPAIYNDLLYLLARPEFVNYYQFAYNFYSSLPQSHDTMKIVKFLQDMVTNLGSCIFREAVLDEAFFEFSISRPDFLQKSKSPPVFDSNISTSLQTFSTAVPTPSRRSPHLESNISTVLLTFGTTVPTRSRIFEEFVNEFIENTQDRSHMIKYKTLLSNFKSWVLSFRLESAFNHNEIRSFFCEEVFKNIPQGVRFKISTSGTFTIDDREEKTLSSFGYNLSDRPYGWTGYRFKKMSLAEKGKDRKPWFSITDKNEMQSSDSKSYTCRSCGLANVKRNQDLCSFCDPSSRARTAHDENRDENKVTKILCNILPKDQYCIYPIGTYAPFRSCADNKKPDIILIDTSSQIGYILEVDENHHSSYDISCEWIKLLNHSQSLLATDGVESVVAIRFNPNCWKVDGKIIKVTLQEKVQVLANLILSTVSKKSLSVYYCFYPGFSQVDIVDDKIIENWMSKLSRNNME